MAVDETLYRATDALILPSSRKFYKASVHAYHWQLRSLISAPHGDYIYYPSNSNIYRINTRTGRRELVAIMKFAPRCLSAARGWICCGGEDGQFAVIRYADDGSATDTPYNVQHVAADSRLPLELDQTRRSDSPGDASTKEHSFVKTAVIGGEIVNCVTFWFPPANPSAELHSSPVVVLANNDRTVTIADLRSSDELQTIKFADCINRAVISPDGQMLIAIGDDPFMYVYSRGLVTSRGQFYIPSSEEALGSLKIKPKYEWTQTAKIQLVGQYQSDQADTRGSFAASFSKSGKYLAIGTQYGVISVFDTALLVDPDADPLITSFTTSRPNTKRGAVRDLEFSPEPYDLLTWTENTGRIGIADARDNFMSRQIISVESRGEGMIRVDPLGGDEAVIPPFEESAARYRALVASQNQGELEVGRSDSPDLLSESIGHRRLRDDLANEMLESVAPETPSAFQVLQALQEQRRAREAMREAEAAAIRDATPIRNTSATMSGARVTSTAITRYRDMLADRTTSPSSTLPSILREFTSTDRSNASLRAYVNERNQERERRGQAPRRRGSIIMEAAGRALPLDRERDFRDLRTARTSQSEANSQDGLTRLPPRLPAIGSDTSNPWGELETLYNIASDHPVDISSRLHDDTGDDLSTFTSVVHARTLAERGLGDLRTGYRSQTGLLRIPAHTDPDETCGCSWSPNGRILYIGTEAGIFEFHVNTIGRKFFPSLTLR